MRKHLLSFEGIEVDLDDPITYERLPKNVRELDDLMFKEIGYALCYMNIFHKDVYGKKKDDGGRRDGGQKKRVKKLIKYFCKERHNHYADVLWLQEQVFLFEDEIENMC